MDIIKTFLIEKCERAAKRAKIPLSSNKDQNELVINLFVLGYTEAIANLRHEKIINDKDIANHIMED
jgi:hypothetical protein